MRRIAAHAGIVVDHGKGAYVYDTAGSRYLDVVSGYGVASLGHCHPLWVQAVTRQAARLTVTPFHTAELARYLEALAQVLPPRVNRTALFSGGAEAIEAAVRLAQTQTGRAGVLTFAGSFHGKTAALRYTASRWSPEAMRFAPPWLHTAPFPECERHDAGTYDSCEEFGVSTLAALSLRTDLDDVGAVLVEPVLGTAGNIPPPRLFLKALREFCDDRNWLLILDESITGFGRTGRLFGFEYFDASPDILVLGKGLGGGFPLSAVCASDEIWEGSSLRGSSSTSSSYGGNPLACTAGLVTLEILREEPFLENVRRVADHAARRLIRLSELAGSVKRPRGVGLMLGFDLVNPETGELADLEHCTMVFRACRDRGLLIAADVARVRVMPPLTLEIGQADYLFDVLSEVLT
jgi:4-aminobutyrate aminotransferase-like enzyme